MALYSCSISNIKRSEGRSSVAKAAYNSRSELLDERTNNKYNYSQKSDLGFSKIITPKNAPVWAKDRQQLWSKNELVNKRRDARVAKEILVALPRELDKDQQFNLVQKFVTNNLTPLGVVADVNAHELEPTDEPDWNPHVHILIFTNHIVDGEFGSKITELNKKEFVNNIREAWAEETNLALFAAGEKARVDHRSNEVRGINRLPQIHLGHKAWAMKEKGIETDRGGRYREIEERNQEVDKITVEDKKVIEEKKSWWEKAKNFVFGELAELREVSTQNQTNLSKPSLEYISEDREELKIALVSQLKNQRQINQKLRRVPGRLALLVRNDEGRVLALESGKNKSQQEKLVIKKNGEKWEIVKYELSEEQRERLMKILWEDNQKIQVESLERRYIKEKRQSR